MLFLKFILDHRIMECFGLEGTFSGHLAQPPCSEQGRLQLNQAAQSPVQPGLEGFQGWGIDLLPGQPVPVPPHPHCKKFLPYVQPKSTHFSFKATPPCSVATGPAENIFLTFPIGPFRY